MSTRPRIAFVIPSLEAGGTERQLIYLLEGLAETHDVHVICTTTGGALAQRAREVASVECLHGGGGWDYRMGSRLGRIFKELQPEVVHTFMFGFDYRVNVAARNAGVPVVVSSRRQLATWKSPRHRRLQRKANALVDCVVANSHAVADFAITQEQADPHLFRVIPNGIDVDRFQSPSTTENEIPCIGIVANFSPVKDHALFLDIADELTQRGNYLNFTLIGDGPLRSDIEKRIEELVLKDRVTLLRGVSDTSGQYAKLAVSVLCSQTEGSPNVVLESMASGTPFVGTDVGGIPELIEDGVTGTLVHTRNPEDFADAIESLLKDPSHANAMAAKAKEAVREEHALSAMVDAYSNLYAELLHLRSTLDKTG